MIPEALPYLCNQPVLVEQVAAKRRCLDSATEILAISQATANELTQFYPGTDGRITVSHLGTEHLHCPEQIVASPSRLANGNFYCLFVGYRFSYKNFDAVVRAMVAKEWPADLDLVVAGGRFGAIESANFGRLRLADRVHDAGWVTDSELAELYRGATCLIFPSLKEGFGLPVVEAQSQGCPVVCADIPCFREVARKSALFFGPASPSELVERAREVRLPRTRAHLQAAGIENLKRFSWDAAARQVSETYEKAASQVVPSQTDPCRAAVSQ
jgi:glycosyltransferase involved in cell wall biosynthesis